MPSLPDPMSPSPDKTPEAAEPAARILLRLLASGARPEQLAAVTGDPEAREDALVVRGVFDAHRRRESELTALVDTARDLAAAQDPAGVLEAIVRRARALLGTDVAYLTLYDPEQGDTYMRTTDGSVSVAFQTVRLSLGDGLGGLAASTHKPYWTADYMADRRFNHTKAIDGAVSDEGLVAICGTPLLVEEEFVGVLFAANRTPRPFTREEVSLLGSLAALAAVSLVQTRAAAETTAALEALETAHATVRQHIAGVERAAAAHDRFTALVLEGGGVDDLTAAVGELLDAEAVFLDTDSDDPLTRLEVVAATRETGRLAHDETHWAVTVSAGPEVFGTLVLTPRGALDDADARTVERAGLVTALMLLFARVEADAEQRVRADLVSDLMTGRGDLTARVARARRHGLDPDAAHVVLVVRSGDDQPRRSLTLSTQSALDGAGLVGEHEGDVVAIVPGDDAATPAHRLAERLGRRCVVTVGGAGPVEGLEALPRLHPEAARTAAALVALGREGEGGAAADLGFAGLVVGSVPDVAGYVRSVLGPVLDYDAARRTDLVHTLEAYFAAGSSPRHAATELHVHVNTVAQRLDRVGALLGERWQSPERVLEVQLALRLRRLLPRP